MKPQVYLAAPFFNEQQLEYVRRVEALLAQNDFDVWSPRERSLCPPNASLQVQARSFQSNITGISESKGLIALMDFLLPAEHSLRVVAQLDDEVKPVTGPIFQPDLGVVWEIGYANAIGIPVIGVFLRDPKRLNLMLAQTLDGYVLGTEELSFFLKVWDGRSSSLIQGKMESPARAALRTFTGPII